MTYAQTIKFLFGRLPAFHNIGSKALKPGLGNTINLCNAIGNPQTKFASVHIAGTNGKGSTSHYLAAILQSAGYRVGLYTSPHVVDFRERIKLNGKPVSKGFVVKFTREYKHLFDSIDASFFEFTAVMAFSYFAEKQVDIAIIETGLGGRLDSTNVITPQLSVITNIGFDHTDILGNTLTAIATEKAGIIKPSIPVVVGEVTPETLPVFLAIAKQNNSPLHLAQNEYNATILPTKQGFNLRVEATELATNKTLQFSTGLGGHYQLKNICTVLTAVNQLKQLGYHILQKDVVTGINNVVALTQFIGRWQIVQRKPLVIADTGHNTHGIALTMQQIAQTPHQHLHIVFGVVADKKVDDVLALLPTNATYYFCKANNLRSLPAETLKQQADAYNLHGQTYSTCKKAYQAALKAARSNHLVFVGGSTFVVGEVLK